VPVAVLPCTGVGVPAAVPPYTGVGVLAAKAAKRAGAGNKKGPIKSTGI